MSKRKSGGSSSSDVKRLDDKATATIAIDFGTAGTGYAYCFAGSDVIEAKQPGGQDARKTLTSLLLDSSTHSFTAFGYDARRIYSESEQGDLFTNYKMLLENVSGPREAMARALNGNCVSLMDVISKTLRYVKDEVDTPLDRPSLTASRLPSLAVRGSQALKECGRALPSGLKATDCQWVVTIPAIWSDAAKGFMRRAAHAAGLVETEGSKRLLLALEPESAAIACDVTKMVRPGQSFMVLDAGGGTVDITMNRLSSASPLRLDEIAAPSGGPWGATFVDSRFEDFVKDLVGSASFAAVKSTPYYIELLENWESVKTSQTADDAPRSINFSPMLEVLDEGTKLSSCVEAYNRGHGAALKMRGRSTIVMDASFVRAFFSSTFTKIASHCSELVKANPVDYIFLVGGFAESELLQAMVKQRFDSSQTKVVVPVRPGLAVLRGAVLFGVNQDVFSSRIARFTYGIEVRSRYDPSNPVHAGVQTRTIVTENGPEQYVANAFSRFVKVGDKLPAGHKSVRGGWRTLVPDQTSVRFNVYSTPLGSIDYTTHQSARKIGSVAVACKHSEVVTVTLQFGATEILAHAYNDTTGADAEATLRYE